MLQKPRMPQIPGVKGEAVLKYCETLRTQEIRHHTAFPKGKKQSDFSKNLEFTFGEHSGDTYFVQFFASLLGIISLRSVFYATSRLRWVVRDHES
jgi:hypothetical protein